jgi:triphosphoribosyl-dephospho-CoA synthetase
VWQTLTGLDYLSAGSDLDLLLSFPPGGDSHADVDAGTFRSSAAAIYPYLRAQAEAGAKGCGVGRLRTVHQSFVTRRLSPGGSADLLAMSLFVHVCETESPRCPL